MKRVALLVLVCVLGFLAVAEAQETPASESVRPKIKLRLPGVSGLETEKELEIKEAVLVNTLSIFIGKTGFVRQRSGLLTQYVFLNTQELGCNRVERPKQTIGAGAKKGTQQADSMGSKPAEPVVGFVAKDPGDFEVRAIGFSTFDPKEMEKDPSAITALRKSLEAEKPITFEYGEFVVGVLHRDLKDGRSVQFNRRKGAATPVLTLTPKDGQWYLKLIADDNKLGVNAELPLKKCPVLESIHIEPK